MEFICPEVLALALRWTGVVLTAVHSWSYLLVRTKVAAKARHVIAVIDDAGDLVVIRSRLEPVKGQDLVNNLNRERER